MVLEWKRAMLVRSIQAGVDRLDPTDAEHQESKLWSVEGSTVVFSLISAFWQSLCSIASGKHCISCGKTLRADTLGKCFIRLRQNLSFVIRPLKIASITVAMSPWMRMHVKSALRVRLKHWRLLMEAFSP